MTTQGDVLDVMRARGCPMTVCAILCDLGLPDTQSNSAAIGRKLNALKGWGEIEVVGYLGNRRALYAAKGCEDVGVYVDAYVRGCDRGKTYDRIVELMKKSGPMTVHDISKALGATCGCVRTHLQRMEFEGDAERVLLKPTGDLWGLKKVEE